METLIMPQGTPYYDPTIEARRLAEQLGYGETGFPEGYSVTNPPPPFGGARPSAIAAPLQPALRTPIPIAPAQNLVGAAPITAPPQTPSTYYTPASTAGLPQLSGSGLPNQGLTQSGGVNYGLIPGMLSNLFGISYPSAFQAAAGSQDFSNWLKTLLSSYPTNYGQNINDILSQLTGATSGNFLNQFAPVQQGNLQSLAQLGLPGNQQLQSEQQRYGDVAQQLIGGPAAGEYGLSNYLQQIITEGLPNQRGIERLTGGQLQYGNQQQQALTNLLGQLGTGQFTQSPAQQQLQNRILGFTQGGGLTPEFVQSQRELVLDPSQEALTGRLNQLAGGTASLASPAYQELLRRNERDFNNQLIGNAFNNLQGFMGQGLQATGQGFGQGTQLADILQRGGQGAISQALQGFGAVPGAVSPFANLLGSTASDLMGQSLNRFATGGRLGLENLSTIQNLAYQPYTTALGGIGTAQGQLLNSLASLLGGEQQYGLGQQSQTIDAIRNLVGMFAAENPPEGSSGAANLGGIASWLLGKIPALNRGNTSGTPPFWPGSGWASGITLAPVVNPWELNSPGW